MAGGAVRIVAGRWRGRRISVVDEPSLRPTPDRVRETLFNWLAPSLAGASCLDLFAGTGALGFESVSRAASSAVLVESNPRVSAALLRTCSRLDADDSVAIVEDDAISWLERAPAARFDIVFVDPPSRLGLHAPALALLIERGWLSSDAQIYLEFVRPCDLPPLPDGWTARKRGKAGDVRYYLASRVSHGP